MGKFYGKIAYAKQVETAKGVWRDSIEERNYFGDVIKNVSKVQNSSENLNDNLNVDNKISILADPFAYQFFSRMRYVVWLGSKWKIVSVDVQRPRLILTIGGIYNEQT